VFGCLPRQAQALMESFPGIEFLFPNKPMKINKAEIFICMPLTPTKTKKEIFMKNEEKENIHQMQGGLSTWVSEISNWFNNL